MKMGGNCTAQASAALVSLLALGAFAVDVSLPAGVSDAGLDYARRDALRLLEQVPGRIALEVDGSLGALERRVATGADGAVTIFGHDAMGLTHALYWYLERHAGVRWYADDVETPATVESLPVVNCTFSPAIPYREDWGDKDGLDAVWQLRNRATNRSAFGMNRSSGSPCNCHSFEHYLKAVADPSLYGVRGDGRKCQTLCMTNPEVRRLVAERMIRYIDEDRAKRAGEPEYRIPKVYELSQLDGGMDQACMCAGCTNLYAREGSYAGPNIAFANAVAEIVGKKYPDVLIRTFAYCYTERPPKTLKAADNVGIRFCRAFLFSPLVKGSYNGKMLEEWCKHAKDRFVWSYWKMYSGPTFPVVKSRTDIAEELRFCRDCGVIGYYPEFENRMLLSFSALADWLRVQFADDPDRDVNRLADEFMRAYYGAAARPMTAYLSYLERRFDEMRSKIDPNFLEETNSGDLAMFTVQDYLDRAFFEKANGWLDEAERLASGDARSLRHVRQERVIVDRSMFDNLAELKRQGYAPDCKAVAARFRANAREVALNWRRFDKKARQERLAELEREADFYARLPLPLPSEFDGAEVVEYNYNRIGNGRREVVADADAVAGFAVRNRKLAKPAFPFRFGYMSDVYRRWNTVEIKENEIPADGKYHLYKVGEEIMRNPLYVFHDNDWAFKTWLPSIGVRPERREIWVSMKLTRKEALLERIFIVKRTGTAKERPYVKADLDRTIECDSLHPYHCQGVATDGAHLYWSFSTELAKTDLTGKTLAVYKMKAGHMGDLCVHDGKIYMGMNMGSARDGTRVGDEVWVFDPKDLKLLKRIPTPQTIWCNNGIEWYGGSFWIVSNVSKEMPYNYVFEYTPDFRFKCCHPIASGRTNLGVQTICYAKGKMLFGCYGGTMPDGEVLKNCVFAVDPAALTAKYRSNEYPPVVPIIDRADGTDAGEGMVELGGRLWLERGFRRPGPNGGKWFGGRLIPSDRF